MAGYGGDCLIYESAVNPHSLRFAGQVLRCGGGVVAGVAAAGGGGWWRVTVTYLTRTLPAFASSNSVVLYIESATIQQIRPMIA